MVRLKSEEEVRCIRKAGEITSKTLEVLDEHVRSGITTYQLDRIARDFIVSFGATPAFKNYKGFSGNTCISVNNVIVHGIPSKKIVLKKGDIVSVDVGVKLDGYFADSAYTFTVGRITESAKKLIRTTKEALYKAIDKARLGNRLGDVSSSVQKFVESSGFSVVRDFVGHGTGYELHEDPEVPNFGTEGTGIRLDQGLVLAIEPMVNEGTHETSVLKDGWTVTTKDGLLSCHFEHTIAVTKGEPEILTKWQKKMQ